MEKIFTIDVDDFIIFFTVCLPVKSFRVIGFRISTHSIDLAFVETKWPHFTVRIHAAFHIKIFSYLFSRFVFSQLENELDK